MLSGDFNFLIVALVGLIAFVLAYLFYQYSQWNKLEWHAKLTVAIAWTTALSYVLLMCPLDIAVTYQARCLAEFTPLPAPTPTPNVTLHASIASSAALLHSAFSSSFSSASSALGSGNGTVTTPCVLAVDDVAAMRTHIAAYWRATFWISSIILGWIVMALQSTYLESGAFSPVKRLKHALRENAYWYGISVAVVGTVVIFLIAQYNADYAIGFVFAASNLYSLFAITCLMSYGLVNVPRRLWFQFRWRAEQQRLHFEAWSLSQARADALYDIKCKIAVVKRLRTVVREDDDALRPLVDQMHDELSAHTLHAVPPKSNLPLDEIDSIPVGDELNEDYLALKRAEIRVSAHEFTRSNVAFARLEARYVEFEDMRAAEDGGEGVILWTQQQPSSTSSSQSLDNEFDTSFCAALAQRVRACLLAPTASYAYRRAEYVWLLHARPLLFGCVFALACFWSAFTVLSEMSLVSGRAPNLSIPSLIGDALTTQRSAPATALFVVFSMMSYQVLATFYTLFRIQIGAFYRIAPHQQTAADMLVTNALLLARFSPALVQNFLKLLREETECTGAADGGSPVCTSFTQFFGAMDLIPLGRGIQVVLPMMLAFLMLLTWQGTHLYVKYFKDSNFVLLDWINDYVETEERVQNGRDTLARSVRRIRDAALQSGSRRHAASLSSSSSSSLSSSTTALAAAGDFGPDGDVGAGDESGYDMHDVSVALEMRSSSSSSAHSTDFASSSSAARGGYRPARLPASSSVALSSSSSSSSSSSGDAPDVESFLKSVRERREQQKSQRAAK